MTSGRLRAAALVTAAGSSSRMGPGIKKEYRRLPGSPETILSAAVRVFAESGLFSVILLTHPAGAEEEARAALAPDLFQAPFPPLLFAPGGASRRLSVLSGLEALASLPTGELPDIVLVHDGARPFPGSALVARVLEEAERSGATVPLLPSVDSLKEVDCQGKIIRHLDRSRVMAVQTPQGFRFASLLDAHRRAEAEARASAAAGAPAREYTDDAEIWDRFRGGVSSVPGEAANRKITYPEDIA